MEENITNSLCNAWQPIVTYVLIFLNIIISIGKQFLNNNKHIKLNNNVDTILTGIKQNNQITNVPHPSPLNTDGRINKSEHTGSSTNIAKEAINMNRFVCLVHFFHL